MGALTVSEEPPDLCVYAVALTDYVFRPRSPLQPTAN